MNSKFKKIWQEALNDKKLPSKFSGVFEIDYNEFKNLKDNFDQKKAENLVKEFMSGKILIVKEAFEKSFVKEIKDKIKVYWKNNPDTFHKMIEGCPDFHRIITPEKAKNYALGAVRHTTYFFNWNNDPCNFNERIYERWRYAKYISGLQQNKYENNTPKDGSVDRIQIVCYPPKYGGVETHKDTTSNSPLAISCYLSSKKDNDFKSGGFYCLDHLNKKINLEKNIEAGDMSLYISNLQHGVEPIDKDSKIKDYDWNSGIGRWWMGLFTNDSNLKNNRSTSISLSKFHSEPLVDK